MKKAKKNQKKIQRVEQKKRKMGGKQIKHQKSSKQHSAKQKANKQKKNKQ